VFLCFDSNPQFSCSDGNETTRQHIEIVDRVPVLMLNEKNPWEVQKFTKRDWLSGMAKKNAVSVDRTRDFKIFSLTLSPLSYPPCMFSLEIIL
jgi:hypothetical protein